MKSGFNEEQRGVQALGGDDLGKVKVDAGDTAGYLGDKLIAGSNVTLTEGAGDITISANVASVSGHQIEGEGVQVPLQPALNFVGGGVTVTDDAVGNKTTVRIKGLKVSEPVTTATLTCEEGWHYVCNGVTTANLPDGVQGMVIGFADYGNTFTANPLTINAFTGDVIGIPGATTLTLDRDSSTVVLGFSSGRWILLSAETFNDLGVASGAGGGTADFPPQSGNSGKFLSTDGTDVSWQTVDALPSQAGQSGKILSTNGTVASWIATPTNGADGASAYEVAVANGFVGDETAWLASLVGATGATGPTGSTGATGATGSVSAATGLTLEHIATPDAPAAGNTIIYGKSDGKIYKRPAGGSEEEIGSGGATAYSALTDVNTTGLTTGQAMIWNGTVWVPGSSGREVLTANRTYYVRTDGNDSNDGLANTAGGAFLTIQKAVDIVASVDSSNYQITIQIEEGGTFTENIILPKTVGSKPPTIQGGASRPTITCSSGSVIIYEPFAVWQLKQLKLTNSTGASDCLFVQPHATCIFPPSADMELGTTQRFHVLCQGVLNWDVNESGTTLTISGGVVATSGASFRVFGGTAFCSCARGTWTITGTPAFGNGTSGSFIGINQGAVADFIGTTITGSATGKRYAVDSNAVVRVTGGSTTFFPGNAAGTTATGGQYV